MFVTCTPVHAGQHAAGHAAILSDMPGMQASTARTAAPHLRTRKLQRSPSSVGSVTFTIFARDETATPKRLRQRERSHNGGPMTSTELANLHRMQFITGQHPDSKPAPD
jgi:hypothetical protein